jgi:hypothetical protein
MADYDPKSIPILDDVIEVIDTPASEPKADTDNNDGAENYLDLFPDNEPDKEPEAEAEAETDSTATENEDKKSRPYTPDFELKEPTEPVESALIAYEEDETVEAFNIEPEESKLPEEPEELVSPEIPLGSESFETDMGDSSAEISIESTPTDELATVDAPEQVSIQAVTDEVVASIMPDLEDHLRALVRKALEDRLPEEVISEKND